MNTNYTVVRGFVAPTPETQPTTIDELVERAIAEHLKFHSDDGLGLFIWTTPDVTGAPLADQLHLTFGADPARSMVASWSTPVRVRRPVLRPIR